MAINDDQTHYETLRELVFDDNKIVTYKALSLLIGVHVNAAKQILYKFYKREKEQGKNVHAIMYISGIREAKESSTPDSSASSVDSIERHCIALCSDSDLPRIKEGYKRVYSAHVYGVSSFPVNDYNVLHQKDNVVSAAEDDFAATHGPFRVYASSAAPVTTVVKTEPARAGNVNDTLPQKKTESGTTKVSTEKKPSLMEAFAAQRQTAGNYQKKEKNSPETKRDQGRSSKTNGVKSSSKKKNEPAKGSKTNGTNAKSISTGKKRSRIIMESDSEDEDEPSPKRTVFDSDDEAPVQPNFDSDEEEEPVAPSSNDEVKMEIVDEPSEPAKTGKRKVYKTVKKSYVDDEGYTVTKKEQVLVTDDEEEEPETPASKARSPAKLKIETKSSPSPKKIANGTSKESKASKDVIAKKKQPSIMSFFTKKN